MLAETSIPFWRSPRNWSPLVFFGIGTGAFMLVTARLPPFYVALGQSPQTAGFLLAGLIALARHYSPESCQAFWRSLALERR